MKILIIHQFYLFPGAPGGSRFNEFARIWSEAGHDVTVIAGMLNYNTGKAPEHLRGRWLVRENDGDVTVWRCHVPETYAANYLGRAWAFFGFMVSAAHATLRAEVPDIVIASSPPLTTALPGFFAARRPRRRIPWVFEIRDLWPESAITTGVLREKSLLARGLYQVERWACKQATRVNVLTPAFRDDLRRRNLANEDQIVFVPNGADLDIFRPGPRDNQIRHHHGWGDRCVILYAGAHGRANALSQLLDVAERLRSRTDILIVSVGDGPERITLDRATKERDLANLHFLGPKPKEQMPDFINGADIGAALLQNNPTFRSVYPNKVFDYMACERPTLLAIDGVARSLVCDEAQAGLFAEPENPEAIAAAIIRLADNPKQREAMGRRGRTWVEANASRTVLAHRYLEILEETLGDHPR